MHLLKNYYWRQSVKASLLTIIILAIFIKLGIWQIHRYHYKKDLEQAFISQQSQAPLTLPQALAMSTNKRFLPITAKGHFDSSHQLLLDNQTQDGQAGFAILTPFIINSTQAILVNRGFVPTAPDRSLSQAIDVRENTRQIFGKLDTPATPFILGNSIEEIKIAWPLKIQRLDYNVLSQHLPYQLLPHVILLDPKETDGFSRNFTPPVFSAEKSLAYAFQWFAFATTLLIIYIFMGFKKNAA